MIVMDKLKANLSLLSIKKQEGKILLIFFVAIVVYFGFIVYADTKKVSQIAEAFNWKLIPLLLLLTLLNYIFRAVRFYYFLKRINISITFPKAFSIFMAGLSMTVTPGKSGEIIKAYLLKKTKNSRFSEVVPLLIIERLTDGIAMILLALGGIVFVKNALLFLLFASVLCLSFIVFILVESHVIKLVYQLEKRYPRFKLLEFFTIFFTNSRQLIGFKALTTGILLGLIAWSFEGYSLYLLVNELKPTSLLSGISLSLFIFSFSSIAGFFVVIPAGIGVAEGAISYFLTTLLSITVSQAVFITVIFRFVTLWFGVSLGLLFLIWNIRRVSK